MKLAIGCDHIVTPIKDEVASELKKLGHEVIDCGTYDRERTHYPIFGQKVGVLVAKKEVDFGICICGTGVGISNSAQKIKGIRNCLVRDEITATEARKNFDANIVSFGGKVTGAGLILDIVKAFISTKYEGQNKEEIAKIDGLIKHENYDLHLLDNEQKKWDEGFYRD
jgi:galactose-6-phosphate isomerase